MQIRRILILDGHYVISAMNIWYLESNEAEMKLVNTQDLQKMFDDSIEQPLENDNEFRAPCYQISVNKDKKSLIFLIDNKEMLIYPYKNIDNSMNFLRTALSIFKQGDMKQLKKFLAEACK